MEGIKEDKLSVIDTGVVWKTGGPNCHVFTIKSSIRKMMELREGDYIMVHIQKLDIPNKKDRESLDKAKSARKQKTEEKPDVIMQHTPSDPAPESKEEKPKRFNLFTSRR